MKGKRVLITGATRGLGRDTAIAFAQAGARLILSARDKEELEKLRLECDNPEEHEIIDLDLIKPQYWHEKLIKNTVKYPRGGLTGTAGYFGDVEIVVHCAGGGLGLKGPYPPAQSVYEMFMLNLGGAIELNRYILPGMQPRGWGRVVHVCSIASGEAVGSVAYNTCKAALGAYVRSLGRELAPFGVVVTGVSPGGFTGPRNAMERLETTNPQAYREFLEKRLPRGFMGKTHEVIALIKFLVSEEASMMGGSVIPIDAGEGTYYGPL